MWPIELFPQALALAILNGTADKMELEQREKVCKLGEKARQRKKKKKKLIYEALRRLEKEGMIARSTEVPGGGRRRVWRSWSRDLDSSNAS